MFFTVATTLSSATSTYYLLFFRMRSAKYMEEDEWQETRKAWEQRDSHSNNILDFIIKHSNTGQDLRHSRDKSTLNFTSKKNSSLLCMSWGHRPPPSMSTSHPCHVVAVPQPLSTVLVLINTWSSYTTMPLLVTSHFLVYILPSASDFAPFCFALWQLLFWICFKIISAIAFHIINPRRACAARVTVLGLCVCYSTSHFSHVYSCHERY